MGPYHRWHPRDTRLGAWGLGWPVHGNINGPRVATGHMVYFLDLRTHRLTLLGPGSVVSERTIIFRPGERSSCVDSELSAYQT